MGSILCVAVRFSLKFAFMLMQRGMSEGHCEEVFICIQKTGRTVIIEVQKEFGLPCETVKLYLWKKSKLIRG